MKPIQIYFGHKLKRFDDMESIFEYVNTKFNTYTCGVSNLESYIDLLNKELYNGRLNGCDIELLDIPNKAYHVTLDYLENKIKRVGLEPPKTNNKTYMFLKYDKNKIIDFINLFYKNNTEATFNVYEIDLRRVKNNLRLFYDPYYGDGVAVYTLNGIPPHSLTIIDKISVNLF